MSRPAPQFITFDLYGTLTDFAIGAAAREVVEDIAPPDVLDAFLHRFRCYQLDEVMGDWRPYDEVVARAFRRACDSTGIAFRPGDPAEIFAAIPEWGPHPDVPEPLARLAERFPLVIVSNAADRHVGQNVAKLGAPFHAVYTAEMARAYKPRLRAFEFMYEQLGCRPEDTLHVSSSPRYDLQSATDLGVRDRVYVNRGHEPSVPFSHSYEVTSLAGVAELLGV
ncbi:haloacid dehalogenase type II [Streptomyces flavofungini]|uniref:Haloacid dehalogenase type II n=1 Tax=Streptomyces flavofungini TaxID=68200 RepID=A0ABS0X1E8_9ACTN|nr:haloacid dehalogenase type II [Streptomyces flavofungini]MBJ3806963.1 haloacid dehalogenase type II [Streptomyces flavofungini]GHC59389.1 dehalogenase [Streptomyces flavofungini]